VDGRAIGLAPFLFAFGVACGGCGGGGGIVAESDSSTGGRSGATAAPSSSDAPNADDGALEPRADGGPTDAPAEVAADGAATDAPTDLAAVGSPTDAPTDLAAVGSPTDAPSFFDDRSPEPDERSADATETGGADAVVDGACRGPKTRFGAVGRGDADPNITSGVGARAADRMYVFNALNEALANHVTVQAFELGSGNPLGSPEPLLAAPADPASYVYDVSVSPTGELVLLYVTSSGAQGRLFASFFKPGPPDGAGVALQVVKTLELEAAGSIEVAPQIIWSVASQAFVVAWKSTATKTTAHVRRFRVDGSDAGGATPVVQTGPIMGSLRDCLVALFGKFLGLAFRSTDDKPYLLILDDQGAQVGAPIKITDTPADNSVTVGGTSAGFVVTHDSNDVVSATFVPVTAAGTVAGAFATYPLSSPWLSEPRFVSDDTGGPGGAGVVTVDLAGARFSYVNADGSKPLTSSLAVDGTNGIQVALTNYHGSFGVSLYDGAQHFTQIAASSCPP
jgi:hypothetical protein